MGPPRKSSLDGRKIGFLLADDAPQQVGHAAAIAYELSREHPECAVSLVTTSAENARAAAALAARFPGQRCAAVRLGARSVLARAQARLGRVGSADRTALFSDHATFLASHDALVAPDPASLRLRSRFGRASPKLIYARFCSGDREGGLDPSVRAFDLVLLTGERSRRRFERAGALPERFAIVGYPKLDAVGGLAAPRARLFANDRPTVLYHPHFSPKLSSWFGMGREVLDFFRRSQRYNLIFAPHRLLFRRRFQIGRDGGFDHVGALPRELLACDHVLVDLGSAASNDLTYTRSADLFLGDVGGLLCEFLLEPRPCVFANPRRLAWRGLPRFEAWALGPVIENAWELEAGIDAAFRTHASIAPAQEAHLRDRFDLQAESSALRAATAIADFLAESTPSPLSA